MDEYIKMCREAVEIQKAWKPKDYQKYCFEDKDTGEWRIDVIPLFGTKIVDKEDKWKIKGYKEMCTFLPSQEDLQEIYIGQINCSPGSTLFDFLVDWFYLHYENRERIPDSFSITTMWLCFVMETCYKKRWNGKTWELIG